MSKEYRFTSLVTTSNGRLSKGKMYYGKFRYNTNWAGSRFSKTKWRIEVTDNFGKRMTFDIGVFASGDCELW